MKKILIIILLIVLVCAAGVFFYVKNGSVNVVGGEDGEVSKAENIVAENVTQTTKADEIGTAGSNMPIKDNEEEAKYQIEVAMQYLFEKIYGDKVFDARINVEKIYTAEEEKEIGMELGEDEVAFEVRYELKPSSSADINELMIPDGEYDKESEWIKDIHRVGVLKPTNNEEQKYEITNFGTGF